MANILIKVGDRSDRPDDWKDGDVIGAFNRNRIRCVHAEHLCHVRSAGFNRDGLRPLNSLARDLRENICQFRMDRVGRHTVERVNLWTGDREQFTGPEFDVMIAGFPLVHVAYQSITQHPEHRRRPDSQVAVLVACVSAGIVAFELDKASKQLTVAGIPKAYTITNTNPENIDVEEWLKRRKKHATHGIFGVSGAESWYGGREDRSDTRLDAVWSAIETKTPRRENELAFRHWPFGGQDLVSHLAITTNDFDDARRQELESEVVDNTDPENPVIVERRANRIDWQNVLNLTAKERADIADRSITVDIREGRQFAQSTIVQRKPQR